MARDNGDLGAGPDRLGDHWDALVSGQPPPPLAADLDPALVDTVRRVRALDDARPPTPAFVAGLERSLMETARQTIRPFPTAPRRLRDPLVADSGRRVDAMPSRRLLGGLRRPRPFPHFATAALLLVTLGGILVAFGGGGRSGGAPLVAASPTAEVTAVGDVPAPEECRVAPRPSIAALATGASPVAAPAKLMETPSLGGEPADAATTAAVTAAVREWTACWIAGDPVRWLSLFSDDYVRFMVLSGTSFTLGDQPPAGLVEFLGRGPRPLPVAERDPAPIVRDVRLLPDGRVSAVIAPPPGSADAGATPSVFVFARDGDRFLIDELRPVVEPGTPTFVRSGGDATVLQPVAFLSEVPNLSAPSVRLREGAVLRVLGEQVEQEDGLLWWPVEDPATGRTGYVLATALAPRPVATPGPVDQAWVVVPIAVHAEGLLGEEPDAVAEARVALHAALDRYDGRCRVAVAHVLAPMEAAPVGDRGARLADTIAQELNREFPALFAGTDFETMVGDETPPERVDLRLSFFAGCTPALGTPIR